MTTLPPRVPGVGPEPRDWHDPEKQAAARASARKAVAPVEVSAPVEVPETPTIEAPPSAQTNGATPHPTLDFQETVDFLEHLRAGGPWVLTAIIPVPNGKTTTSTAQSADDVRTFASTHNGKKNLYYSVNPTRTTLTSKAKKIDIAAIEYLLADLDPNGRETPEDAKARYREALKAYDHKESLLIDSGNGVQALWKLAEPIVLGELANGVDEDGKPCKVLNATDKVIADDVEARCAALMTSLGGSKGTQNIDRILRLPGTINLPTPTKLEKGRIPCPAKLLDGNGATYKLDDFPKPLQREQSNSNNNNNVPDLPRALATMLYLPNLGAGAKHGEYKDRSALIFAFLTEAIRRRVADDTMMAACLDEKHSGHAIFEHIKENGGRTYLKRQIEHAHKTVGEHQNETQPITATPYQWCDPTKIPPRDFLYGKHLIRKFLSGKVSQGGVGKSTLIAAEALAMTSGRSLLGVIPKGRLRVWLWNLEDPKVETERKIQAAALHYNLKQHDVEDYLFVDSGRDQKLVIAETTRDGAKIMRPIVDSLIDQVIARKIDVLIIDPFVSSHRVVENSNDDMDLVVKQWSEIAEFGNCAVELVHHSKKGELEKTVESSRGAIAITDAWRSAQVLNRMTKDEAKRAGVKNHRLYFRVYTDKANLAPPVETSNWFKLESIALGNGPHFGGAGGDEVGVAVQWQWPNAMAGVTDDDFAKIAEAIKAGQWRANSQADNWVGKAVAEVLDVDLTEPMEKAKISAMLKDWLAAAVLVEVDGLDAKRQTKKFVEVAAVDVDQGEP